MSMNDKIDIIVPWLNGNDIHWQNEYKNYLKTQRKGDSCIIRTREWDMFPFFLRSVAENCKWVNKLFICVFDEHQIPAWLNTDNDKLKIIYHKDILNPEILPTFNGLCIESYMVLHKELSNNFVLCNDDFLFVNPTAETDYFRNNICVKYKEPLNKNSSGTWGYFNHKPDVWQNLMKNTVRFKEKITGNSTFYPMYHIPEAFHKSDFINFFNSYGNIMDDEYKKYSSKIRQDTNLIASSIVKWIQLDNNDFISDKNFINDNLCIDLTDRTNWKKLMDCCLKYKTICINDQVRKANQQQYLLIKTRLNRILITIFPNKCEFEK